MHLITSWNFFTAALAGSLVILARRRTRADWIVAVGLLISSFGITFLTLLSALQPRILDATLYKIDLLMRIDPLIFARFVIAHPWIRIILKVVYEGLPLIFGIAYASERSEMMIRTALLAGIAGFVFYNLVPAIGPAYAFVNYPHDGFLVVTQSLRPRNCFPSLHLSWAILIARSVVGGRLRWLCWIFVVLTGFATIGLGEHYFIDLIASIPFVFAIEYAAAHATFPGNKFWTKVMAESGLL